ncbi:hypothetical protein OUZ56_019218 [Daphnia magna]|uniref:Uncharacterized protein n=2 Tax=Daphnia magna TaxID=35525 RepID=A0ABQ9ZBM0_9CRUS|nr:hypothetical protein OUZ56_019218 [Daphnia magna]
MGCEDQVSVEILPIIWPIGSSLTEVSKKYARLCCRGLLSVVVGYIHMLAVVGAGSLVQQLLLCDLEMDGFLFLSQDVLVVVSVPTWRSWKCKIASLFRGVFLSGLEIMAVFSNAYTFFIRVCCTSVSHCWYLGPIGLLTSLDHRLDEMDDGFEDEIVPVPRLAFYWILYKSSVQLHFSCTQKLMVHLHPSHIQTNHRNIRSFVVEMDGKMNNVAKYATLGYDVTEITIRLKCATAIVTTNHLLILCPVLVQVEKQGLDQQFYSHTHLWNSWMGLDQPFYSHTYHWNSGMVAVVAGHSPWFVSEVPESSISRTRI